MDASSQENMLKKRLQNFLHELQRMGTVQGFKHFSCYLRGREELVVTVNNTLQGSTYSSTLSAPPSRKQSICHSDSFTSSRLPYDKGSLVLSYNTQLGLGGFREKGVGLPPASPSEEEGSTNETTTLFLVAGYSRYSCPYVWVRSNHERLFKLSGDHDSDKDSPLKLKSTAKWKDSDVHIIDIISELVRLCTYPSPRNPFEIDLEYFHQLTTPEQLLTSAAMMNYLQKVVINTPDSKPYAGKVFEDLQRIAKLHFGYLETMSLSTAIPIMKKLQHHPQQQNQRYSKAQTRPVSAKRPQQYYPQMAAPTGRATMPVQPQVPVPVQPHGPAPMTVQPPGPSPMSVPPRGPAPMSVPPRGPAPMSVPPRGSAPMTMLARGPAPMSVPPRGPVPFSAQPPSPAHMSSQPPRPAHMSAQPSSPAHMSVQPTRPVNATGKVYGQGPSGVFPGGFERMPAPSMF